MLDIYVDADGCTVKPEIYKVATRYKLKVCLVANHKFIFPDDPMVNLVVVSGGFDAADDWIVENVQANDIVITTDILLADRCIKRRARVLGPKGVEFTEDNIGNAVATRELMQNLRYMGENHGGPAPMQKKDRSQFLNQLDQIINAIRKNPAK